MGPVLEPRREPAEAVAAPRRRGHRLAQACSITSRAQWLRAGLWRHCEARAMEPANGANTWPRRGRGHAATLGALAVEPSFAAGACIEPRRSATAASVQTVPMPMAGVATARIIPPQVVRALGRQEVRRCGRTGRWVRFVLDWLATERTAVGQTAQHGVDKQQTSRRVARPDRSMRVSA